MWQVCKNDSSIHEIAHFLKSIFLIRTSKVTNKEPFVYLNAGVWMEKAEGIMDIDHSNFKINFKQKKLNNFTFNEE